MYDRIHEYCVNLLGPINKAYTLLKKKHTFNSSISPGDPGSGSMTLGHAQHFQCSWQELTLYRILPRAFKKVDMTQGY